MKHSIHTALFLGTLAMLPVSGAYALDSSQQLQMIDTNRDGKISRSEFDKHQTEEFKASDTNRDGSLDSNEFRQMVSSKDDMRGRYGTQQGSSSQNSMGSRSQDSSSSRSGSSYTGSSTGSGTTGSGIGSDSSR